MRVQDSSDAGRRSGLQAIRLSTIAGASLAVVLLSGCGGGVGKATNGGLGTSVPPPVHTVGLPAEHDLASWLTANPGGMVTVPAGEHRDIGGVRFSCPTGGDACEVSVMDDDAVTATSTGSMALAAPVPPPVHTVGLPAEHDLANWLTANPGGMVTVLAGERRDVGGVRFSCPAAGADCAVAVTSADGSTRVSSTGGMATAEGHSAILNRILRSADTLLVSERPFSFQASCSVATCTWDTVWILGLPFKSEEQKTIVLPDLTDEAMDWSAATKTHRGVSLVSEVSETAIASVGASLGNLTGYSGWLDHNFFVVAHGTFSDDDFEDVSRSRAMSIGDATGTNPTSVTGSAIWSGIMVGVDVSTTEAQSNRIRGDADLTIADFTDPELDVAFTNISDVDSGQQRADMTWDDLWLTDGSFGTWSGGNSIQGRFYGPNHEEVGGIFERDQVIGAFGTKSDTMLPSTPTVRPVDNGESPMRVEPAKVRSLTGSGAPTFFRGDVLPTINRISQRANSLLASDVIDFSQDPPVRGQTTCSGIRCEATAEKSGYYAEWEWEVEEIRVSHQGTIDAVAEHRGVSLAQVVDRHEAPFENESFAVYGGWLDHSYFWVSAEFDRRARRLSEDVDAVSVGYATGTNPVSGGASWHGVMVGRDVSATVARGYAIQGNTEVTIADFANPRVGVAFTSIKDLNTGGSRGDMTWSGISLTSGGFGTGSDGNSIEGKFYGPNHEEVGGIFERDQVIGAFGAKRP